MVRFSIVPTVILVSSILRGCGDDFLDRQAKIAHPRSEIDSIGIILSIVIPKGLVESITPGDPCYSLRNEEAEHNFAFERMKKE